MYIYICSVLFAFCIIMFVFFLIKVNIVNKKLIEEGMFRCVINIEFFN